MATEYDTEANTVLYFLYTSPILGDNEEISEHQSTCTMYVENYEIEYHDSEDILVFSLFDFDYVW